MNVEIYALGELRIIVNNFDIIQKIKQSPKKIMLLEFLIVNNGKAVTTSSIIDALWYGRDDFGLENTLKTLISRLRKDLADSGLPNAIVTKRGAYMWNPDIECMIDIVTFENLANKLANVEVLNDDNIDDFDTVLYLYSDDLLVSSSLSNWFSPKNYYFHTLYLKTITRYINLLNVRELYGDVIRVCKTALEIDMFDTMLNLELMRALLKLGKNKEALERYQNVTDLHYNHLGIKPSEEILDFYKLLIMEEQNTESNIEDIYNELRNDEEERDAFVCEYTIFKDIYRLYMRNLKRLGTNMHLAIVTIHGSTAQEIDPILMDKTMRGLRNLLQTNLRSGDTISRYSPNQFVILLPNIDNSEMGKLVLKRLQGKFFSDSRNTKFSFDFKLLEVFGTDDKLPILR